MSNAPKKPTLAAAQALQQAGRLGEAEKMCAQVLQADPENPDGWFLFGVLALQTGRHAKAAERLERAVRSRTTSAPYYLNLGLAYQGLARLAEAQAALEKAVARDPKLPEAHNNLGVVRLAQGQRAEAGDAFRRAIALRPTYARAHYNLGTVLKDEGRTADAAASFGEAARLEPALAQAHANLGVVLQELGDRAGANAAYMRALELMPDEPETLNNLGTLRRAEGRLDEAAALFERLIARNPNFAEAYLNLGSVRQAQDRLDDATAAYRRALAHGARPEAVFYNLGLVHDRKEEAEQALACYADAIRAKPDYAEPRWNAALTHLMRGDFAEGWRGYEHRWQTPLFKGRQRPHKHALWDGRRDLPGALLVWGEQGIGDEILYGRMACDLADAGMRVAYEADARLVPLFARGCAALRPIARRPRPDPASLGPDIVAQIPVASLGQFLRPTRDAFPADGGGYLRADPGRVESYRRRLRPAASDDLVVGVSWISKNPDIGSHKTMPLTAWAPILKTPGVRFVDLQYGDTTAERAEAERVLGARVEHLPDLDLFNDIDGVAALIAACDLVITVSNTTAHLAGALGVPVWVMVPRGYGKLWYWGVGETTPWYPCARIFRQGKAGDWEQPIARIASDLAAKSR